MLKSEKETVILWDSERELVSVHSHHNRVWRRLEAAGFTPVASSVLAGREVARRYLVPLRCFRYGFVREDQPRRRAPKTAFRPHSSDKKPGR